MSIIEPNYSWKKIDKNKTKTKKDKPPSSFYFVSIKETIVHEIIYTLTP